MHAFHQQVEVLKAFQLHRASCSKAIGCRYSVLCGYSESVTANTVFHGMKMPVLKAFHMIFRLTAKKKGISTTELGSEVGVQQKTAWLFKRKVQVAMKQDSKDKLKAM